jgi:hypothetical protein
MSLVTVTAAVSDFVASAWLVAVTCTFAGEGKSAGAVYTPPGVIVPVAALPPALPFTLQSTLVSVVFVTVAENVTVFPSSTDPLFGATVTAMERGGGGGGTAELAPPPPQPCVHAPVVRSAAKTVRALPNFFFPLCVRGRIPLRNAGEGPAKNSCHIEVVLDVGIETLLL